MSATVRVLEVWPQQNAFYVVEVAARGNTPPQRIVVGMKATAEKRANEYRDHGYSARVVAYVRDQA